MAISDKCSWGGSDTQLDNRLNRTFMTERKKVEIQSPQANYKPYSEAF